MINWNDLKGLHVISKLEEILNKWFGVEAIYTDAHYKVRSGHMDKDYEFKNHFFKVQMSLPHGYDFLASDIERITEDMYQSKQSISVCDSYFPGVKMIASRIEIDGERLGTVFALPFVFDTFTEADKTSLVKMLVENGAVEADAQNAVSHLKMLSASEVEYLEELVGLVSGEVVTFHSEISKREERIHMLNSELGEKFRYHNMIGKSKPMQKIYTLLERISNSESSVLIQGENGTGKELIAKAIHFHSPRKDYQFLAVNCSAFNDNLLDSELFGHVKGAFTGAIKDKPGFFEVANGGTLFLDEIGDTSLSMQVKLLRVLQEGTYMPVGAEASRKTDVRILAATNKDLKKMMASGEFREDLYYRINVLNVNLPSLKERKEDIPVLMDHFLKRKCDEQGMPMKQFSKKCMEKMLDYAWPGNVRQLENEVERLVVLAGEDKTITPDLLSPQILDFGAAPEANTRGVNTNGKLKDALHELEVIMIREGLKRCNFNKSKLAKELGISRASLIMKVEKYELDKRKKAAGE
ncbi:sigma-54-dependent Fis family transcriptional regulator [Bacteriovorax sp. Seq25_V]|uniref:sigma-54 interaction domain-containing protein n=1 Tax=Bacteriovorax sp. Seq25_V TaxID=1201288 RepID=UPI000389DA33|nr:sigma 54-interacting transcriptional regulator [Bacteriovorax sp. Seq25_V]EQC46852.1 sigma-54 interaction domain protein [Bacteriovorax sp. Seq25_V]